MGRPEVWRTLGPNRGLWAHGVSVRQPRGGGFVPDEGHVIVVTSSVGELEESLDVVSLVSRKHAVLETLGDDGAEGVPFFPRYVWGGVWYGTGL